MKQSAQLSKIFDSIREKISRYSTKIQKKGSSIRSRRKNIVGTRIEKDKSIRKSGISYNGCLNK